MSPRLTAAARAVLRRDRRALGRLISAVEDRDPSAEPTLRSLYARTGRAMVVGLAGPLGVGKSSLVSSLVALLRSRGTTVGIVAVDPSSPFTGGSVLGDRIRLDRVAGDPGIFFRSMASRGHPGGVASATREVVRLLDAFGMDVVLVETVGSGQVDVEIRDIASTSVVVLVPHLGDEVQTLKAGLFEIADVFVVNKSDLPGADRAARDLSELVATGVGHDGWRAAVVPTSTQLPLGIAELWTAVEAHEQFLDADGRRAAGERTRCAAELAGLVQERVDRTVQERLRHDRSMARLLDAVADRTLDPYTATERLLGRVGRTRPRAG